MSIQESGENGSFMVMIWLLSKYSVILTVALSLLSQQYEGSFLATKLCSQTTPVKNNSPEEEEAASRALLPCVPWPHQIRWRMSYWMDGRCLPMVVVPCKRYPGPPWGGLLGI